MVVLKYSRQRECIKKNLAARTDHPTADMVFSDIQNELPNISLGTVYRNLSLLCELGEAQKISDLYGPDRFDAVVTPHYHFQCRECGKVIDLPLKYQESLNDMGQKDFDGIITVHGIMFTGLCGECLKKGSKDSNISSL